MDKYGLGKVEPRAPQTRDKALPVGEYELILLEMTEKEVKDYGMVVERTIMFKESNNPDFKVGQVHSLGHFIQGKWAENAKQQLCEFMIGLVQCDQPELPKTLDDLLAGKGDGVSVKLRATPGKIRGANRDWLPIEQDGTVVAANRAFAESHGHKFRDLKINDEIPF